MSVRPKSVSWSESYDLVLAYMRRRRFEDVDGLADRMAGTLAECLSAGLDAESTLDRLLGLNSRSFSINRISKSEFLSDAERHVRAQFEKLPTRVRAPDLRETVLTVLDVDDAPTESTQAFRGKSHDVLLRQFADWMRQRIREVGLTTTWAVSQGRSDQGVDAIIEVTGGPTGRLGIQLENDGTVKKHNFADQMARVYALYDINQVDLLLVVFCGDETNGSVREKVRRQVAIAAQKADRAIVTIEPTKAISILGPYLQ
jgi:hypothetical protein